MQHLLLLHGAIGAKDQLLPLARSLQNNFVVHSPNFTGHGGEPIPASPFSIPLFAEQVMLYMDRHIPAGATVHLFGYSMGGYVGLYISKQEPDRFDKLVTLATKFHWDETTATKEVKMLEPDTVAQKVPAFAAQLEKRHAPEDWKAVMKQTTDMMLAMGKDNPLKPEDYTTITASCLLLLGDRDKMVTLEETQAVYKQLPKAQLGVLPGAGHALEQVDLQQLVFQINLFLKSKG
jgi:pimeloyl-ACP methyl ester carboxylesterase